MSENMALSGTWATPDGLGKIKASQWVAPETGVDASPYPPMGYVGECRRNPLLSDLPSPRIEHHWRGADGHMIPPLAEMFARHRTKQKTVGLPDGWTAFDYCYWPMHSATPSQPHSYHVAMIADHPFMAVLDELPHVPKVVRHMYRGPIMFRHLIATDGWGFHYDWKAAQEAWGAYIKNQAPPVAAEPVRAHKMEG